MSVIASRVTKPSYLIIVVDTHPYYWAKRNQDNVPDPYSISELLSSLQVFINAYTLLDRANQYVIISAHTLSASILASNHPLNTSESNLTPGVKLVSLRLQLKGPLQELCGHSSFSQSSESNEQNASVAASFRSGSKITAALSIGMCIARQKIQQGFAPRVLVTQISPDYAPHYVSMMNTIFFSPNL